MSGVLNSDFEASTSSNPARAKLVEKFVDSMERKRSCMLQTFREQKVHFTDLLGTKEDESA